MHNRQIGQDCNRNPGQTQVNSWSTRVQAACHGQVSTKSIGSTHTISNRRGILLAMQGLLLVGHSMQQ